jgi:hypothetical protein
MTTVSEFETFGGALVKTANRAQHKRNVLTSSARSWMSWRRYL